MKNWTPGDWVLFFGAVTTLLASLTASVIAIINASKANAKSDTNTSNTQALAAGVLSTSKAINAATGVDNVPAGVTEAARAIRNDPTTPAPVPVHTDPEPVNPLPMQVRT